MMGAGKSRLPAKSDSLSDATASDVATLDVERLQRRKAVEGHGRVGRRIGAGAFDQHLVADLEAYRQRIRHLLVQHVGRIAGRAGEYARPELAAAAGADRIAD